MSERKEVLLSGIFVSVVLMALPLNVLGWKLTYWVTRATYHWSIQDALANPPRNPSDEAWKFGILVMTAFAFFLMMGLWTLIGYLIIGRMERVFPWFKRFNRKDLWVVG